MIIKKENTYIFVFTFLNAYFHFLTYNISNFIQGRRVLETKIRFQNVPGSPKVRCAAPLDPLACDEKSHRVHGHLVSLYIDRE